MAQVHVRNSQRREPQRSGIHGWRRRRDAVTACGVKVRGVLLCFIHSVVERASPEPNLKNGIWAYRGVPKTKVCFRPAPSAPIADPVLSFKATICALSQL